MKIWELGRTYDGGAGALPAGDSPWEGTASLPPLAVSQSGYVLLKTHRGFVRNTERTRAAVSCVITWTSESFADLVWVVV